MSLLIAYWSFFIAPAEDAAFNIVVSLTCTAYLCGSLIAFCPSWFFSRKNTKEEWGKLLIAFYFRIINH